MGKNSTTFQRLFNEDDTFAHPIFVGFQASIWGFVHRFMEWNIPAVLGAFQGGIDSKEVYTLLKTSMSPENDGWKTIFLLIFFFSGDMFNSFMGVTPWQFLFLIVFCVSKLQPYDLSLDVSWV